MEERKAEHFLEGKTQQVPGERKAETYDYNLYKAISILNEKPGSFSSVFTGFFLAIFKQYFNKRHASSCNTKTSYVQSLARRPHAVQSKVLSPV